MSASPLDIFNFMSVMCVGSYSSFDVIPSKNTRASAARTSANRLSPLVFNTHCDTESFTVQVF